MGRQPSWAISSNVRWAWRLSRRLIWLQSFWNSDIYSSPKFLLFGGTSLFSCMPVFLFLDFPLLSLSLVHACYSFTSLSFPVPSGFALSHYLSVSLSLSQISIFKLGSFQKPAFRRCTTQQSVISVTDSVIIHYTSKTLEHNTWPEFEQKCMGYLVFFRQLPHTKRSATEVLLYCTVELQSRMFTGINPSMYYCLCTLEVWCSVESIEKVCICGSRLFLHQNSSSFWYIGVDWG